MITLKLTIAEASLLGQALALHTQDVEKTVRSFEGCEDKYRAAHDYFKKKLEDARHLHVKVIQARV